MLNEIWQHFFFLFLQSFHLLHIKAIVYIRILRFIHEAYILAMSAFAYESEFLDKERKVFFHIMVKKINPSMMRNTAIYLNRTHTHL